ncbi:hypothetical protein D3C76_1307370 [compost metagenome]
MDNQQSCHCREGPAFLPRPINGVDQKQGLQEGVRNREGNIILFRIIKNARLEHARIHQHSHKGQRIQNTEGEHQQADILEETITLFDATKE